MDDKKTKRLALGGQLCAVTLVLTLVSLPLPGGHGYVNLGDAGVYLCALLLPGWFGWLAAAAGSVLADVALGWALYAPATFLIKGLTALLVSLSQRRPRPAASAMACCMLVPLGYFLYEWALFSLSAALPSLLPNVVQALLGAGLGLLVGRKLQGKWES